MATFLVKIFTRRLNYLIAYKILEYCLFYRNIFMGLHVKEDFLRISGWNLKPSCSDIYKKIKISRSFNLLTVSNQINLQINSPNCKLVNIHFNAVKLAHHQYFQCLKSGYMRFINEQWSCNMIKIKAIVDMNC